MIIYDDQLGDGWQDWSWGTKDFGHTDPVHAGKASIFLAPGGNRGLYLHHDTFSTGGYGTLQAFVHGDTKTRLCLVGADLKFAPYVTLTPYLRPDPAGRPGWQKVSIPLTALGVPRGGQQESGIVFQPDVSAAQPLVVDDVSLLPDLALPPAPTAATIPVTVNAASGRHPISPFIYGMAFAPDDYLTDLRLGVNRWGGNDKSRYNWVQGNAVNAAMDWEYRNRFASDGTVPPRPSSAADRFVTANKTNRVATLLTVPTLGWVAKDTDNSHQSVNVPNNGGPGLSGPDGPIAGYDPTDNRNRTSVRSVARKNAPFADPPSPGRRRRLSGRVDQPSQERLRRRLARRRPVLRDGQRAGFVGCDATGRPPGPHGVRRCPAQFPGLRHGGEGRGPDRPDHRSCLVGLHGVSVFGLGSGRRQL